MQSPPSGSGQPLDRHAAGRLMGAYQWIEKRLFHLVGTWVTVVPSAPVKIFLDQQSLEFAWHAELWSDRLPDHRGADGLSESPNSGVAAVFAELEMGLENTDVVEKLTAIYRVILPRLITAYSSHLEKSSSGGHDPTQRVLRLVLADELTAWRAGEAQLEAAIVDQAAIDRSVEQQRKLEGLLVAAGGIAMLEA